MKEILKELKNLKLWTAIIITITAILNVAIAIKTNSIVHYICVIPWGAISGFRWYMWVLSKKKR